jgi:hypothetical protein
MAGNTNDMNYATIMAESGAEAFKAVGNDTQLLAGLLGGTSQQNTVLVYYCANWRATVSYYADYVMTLYIRSGDFGLLYCDISVEKLDDGENEEIVAFTAARRYYLRTSAY